MGLTNILWLLIEDSLFFMSQTHYYLILFTDHIIIGQEVAPDVNIKLFHVELSIFRATKEFDCLSIKTFELLSFKLDGIFLSFHNEKKPKSFFMRKVML